MKQNIIDVFQQEFKRLMSPKELEIINDWKNEGYDDGQIEEALKQSVYNGALSLRYIYKVLQSTTSKEETKKELKEETKKELEQDLSWLNN